jgi:hypothetical protein
VLKVAGWEKARPWRFPSKLTMNGKLPVTQDYVDRVRSSKPIAYWRFERVLDSAVPNEIDGGLSLAVQGQPSLVGDRDNRSAEFTSDGDTYLTSEGKLPLQGKEYSVEAWIKPSHLHRGVVVNLACDDDHKSSRSRLELQGGIGESLSAKHHQLRFFHLNSSETQAKGASCWSSRAYTPRRWQHIVAVKSKSQMALYVDGKLSGANNESTLLPSDAVIVVGLHGSSLDRKFIGQIDELAIYDRALKEKEVSLHYRTVKRAHYTTPNQSSGDSESPKESTSTGGKRDSA